MVAELVLLASSGESNKDADSDPIPASTAVCGDSESSPVECPSADCSSLSTRFSLNKEGEITLEAIGSETEVDSIVSDWDILVILGGKGVKPTDRRNKLDSLNRGD